MKGGGTMPVKKLKNFLEIQNIKYVTISHSASYTAQEIAASAHIPGKDLAKTVMVKIDGKMAMVALSASCKIDFGLLKKTTGANEVGLAEEKEFERMFPECEVGAMPPFGNLYGMEVFVDESLAEDEKIAFNAGTHTELIELAYNDFDNAVKPRTTKLSL